MRSDVTQPEPVFFEFTPAVFILKFLIWDSNFRVVFTDEASKQVSEVRVDCPERVFLSSGRERVRLSFGRAWIQC